MFKYLKGVADQLCKITPQGVDAVRQHMETLKSFNGVLHDAQAMDSGESHYEDDFEMLINRVLERIEEIAEYLEEFHGQSEAEENLDKINREYPELLGIAGELAHILSKLLQAQMRIEEMPRTMVQVMLMKDVGTLASMLHNTSLAANGVIARIEKIKSGVFDE